MLQLPSSKLIPLILLEKNCEAVQNNAKLWLLVSEHLKIHLSFPSNQYSFFSPFYIVLVFTDMALIFWISVHLNNMTKGKFSTATFCCLQMGIFSYYVYVCVWENIWDICVFLHKYHLPHMIYFFWSVFLHKYQLPHTIYFFLSWAVCAILQFGYSWMIF